MKPTDAELEKILNNIILVYKNKTIGEWHSGRWAKSIIQELKLAREVVRLSGILHVAETDDVYNKFVDAFNAYNDFGKE